MILNPQKCPACENLLLALHDEEDPTEVLYMCSEMTCASLNKDGSRDIWNFQDLMELREAKAKYGSLTKDGRVI